MSLLERLKPLASGRGEDWTELAGLGTLAIPSVDSAQAHVRAGLAGDYNQAGVEKRTLLPHAVKPATEIAGLGTLAIPAAYKLFGKHAMSSGLFNELKTTAGAGAKLNLGAITRGPVLKSETGALQSAARKGLGGFNTMPPPPRAAPIVGHIERDPFAAMPKAAMVGFFDELAKLGAVTDDEARRALDRYDNLEQNKPTLGQVGRYGGLGAAAGAGLHALGRTIEGGTNPVTRRSLGGAALTGAISMGAVPLLRNALDQHTERGTLKKYLSQEHLGEYAPNQGAATDVGTPTGLSR
jgi:hypothetical protein